MVKCFSAIKEKPCTQHLGDSKEYPESIYQMLQFVKTPFIRESQQRKFLKGFCAQKQLLKYFLGSAAKERRGHYSYRGPDYV